VVIIVFQKAMTLDINPVVVEYTRMKDLDLGFVGDVFDSFEGQKNVVFVKLLHV